MLAAFGAEAFLRTRLRRGAGVPDGSGESGGPGGFSWRAPRPWGFFCTQVTSAGIASFYGVSYHPRARRPPRPPGTTFIADMYGEGVYAVPDSGRATLLPLDAGRHGAERPDQRMERARESAGGTWHIVVDAPGRRCSWCG